MNKKIIAITMSALMVTGLLVGCGGSTEATTTKINAEATSSLAKTLYAQWIYASSKKKVINSSCDSNSRYFITYSNIVCKFTSQDLNHKVAQGFAYIPQTSDHSEYYVCAFEGKNGTKSQIYILNSKMETIKTITNQDFGHVNSITYGDDYLYILSGEYSSVSDYKIYMMSVSDIDKGNVSFKSPATVSNGYQYLAYDELSHTLYGGILQNRKALKIYEILQNNNNIEDFSPVYSYTPNTIFTSQKDSSGNALNFNYFGQLSGMCFYDGKLYVGRNYYCCQQNLNGRICDRNNAFKYENDYYSKTVDVISLSDKKLVSSILVKTDLKEDINEMEGIALKKNSNETELFIYENSQIGVTQEISKDNCYGRLLKLSL